MRRQRCRAVDQTLPKLIEEKQEILRLSSFLGKSL